MDKLKIAHIGTGNRGTGVYLPLIAKLNYYFLFVDV